MKLSSFIVLSIFLISTAPIDKIQFPTTKKAFAFDAVRNEGYIAFVVNEENKQNNKNNESKCECGGTKVIIHGDGHKTPCPCPGTCNCSKTKTQEPEQIQQVEQPVIKQSEPEAKTSDKVSEKYKYVIYHLGADWCGPCQLLKKNTWQNEDVKNFFDKEKIKLYTFEEENQEYKKYFSYFKVKNYPTILLFKSDNLSTPIQTYTGYYNSDAMLSKLKQVIK
jgi:thiol-disulfide isomerase/thioredoxin